MGDLPNEATAALGPGRRCCLVVGGAAVAAAPGSRGSSELGRALRGLGLAGEVWRRVRRREALPGGAGAERVKTKVSTKEPTKAAAKLSAHDSACAARQRSTRASAGSASPSAAWPPARRAPRGLPADPPNAVWAAEGKPGEAGSQMRVRPPPPAPNSSSAPSSSRRPGRSMVRQPRAVSKGETTPLGGKAGTPLSGVRPRMSTSC
jgi:hypothetical protein